MIERVSSPILAIILQNRNDQAFEKKMQDQFYSFMSPSKVFVQQIELPQEMGNLKLSVLRTDLIDPVISGNKYFKLIAYLQEAIKKNHVKVATFGGPYSNHLVAFARMCQQINATRQGEIPLEFLGVVRGRRKEGHPLSATLDECVSYGMKLHFVDHVAYEDKQGIQQQFPDYFWIGEGGYGALGAEGFRDLAPWILPEYSHLLCASGTGTTAAGLVKVALAHQEVCSFSIVGDHLSLESEIKALLNEEEKLKKLKVYHGFEQGGYAKKSAKVFDFMNQIWKKHKLPTDFIYTAKMFIGIFELMEKGGFVEGSHLLAIHTGGLQGNRSLKTQLSFRYPVG